jgi:hypothetical protein
MRTHLVTAFATVSDRRSIAIPGQAVNSVIKEVNKKSFGVIFRVSSSLFNNLE